MTSEQIAEARRIIESAKSIPCGRNSLMDDFLSHARTGWPEALDEIETLRKELKDLQNEMMTVGNFK